MYSWCNLYKKVSEMLLHTQRRGLVPILEYCQIRINLFVLILKFKLLMNFVFTDSLIGLFLSTDLSWSSRMRELPWSPLSNVSVLEQFSFPMNEVRN